MASVFHDSKVVFAKVFSYYRNLSIYLKEGALYTVDFFYITIFLFRKYHLNSVPPSNDAPKKVAKSIQKVQWTNCFIELNHIE